MALLCECGLDITPQYEGDEGWFFHAFGGHKIHVSCGRKIGPFDCCSVVEGDCLELMKQLPDGCVDAVFADPPYGVNLASWDSEVLPTKWLEQCRKLAKSVYVTPGNGNQHLYPQPAWTLAWARPGSIQLQRGGVMAGGSGFSHWEPILVYGKSFVTVDCKVLPPNTMAGEINHPCPKPLALLNWIIGDSPDGITILDPFCGSGTTLVAAKKLGRHFLGFEISREYCEIARQRLARIDAQPSLFQSAAEQEVLIFGDLA